MSALNTLFKVTLFTALFVSFNFGRLSARTEETQEPVLAINDALGRQVALSASPERIVTIFSSNTELVAALGLGDRIVGIDAQTFYPPEIVDRPKIGGRLGISLEQVVAQKPDLIIMTPARQAVHNLLSPLEKLGIPTVVLTSRNMNEIMDNIQKIAAICGTPKSGYEILDKMRRTFAEVRCERTGRPVPTVVLITSRLSNGLFMAARKGTYTADAVELAGGQLILDLDSTPGLRLPQISPETLLSLDPDIIIYTRRHGEGTEIGDYLKSLCFAALKAQQNGDIYDVPSSEFLIPGPRVVNGVRRLADIFNQWDRK